MGMDEDEVDILGDFNLDESFTKNDNRIWTTCYENECDDNKSLPCSASTTECNISSPLSSSLNWPQDVNSFSVKPSQDELLKTSPIQITSFFTKNIDNRNLKKGDSCHWTDKECYLLEKGLELFGRSWSRLSQYIGSKTSQQVRSKMKSLSTLKHVNSSESSSDLSGSLTCQLQQGQFDGSQSANGFSDFIVMDDVQIPASFEEVISTVTTAQPTVVEKKVSKKRIRMGSKSGHFTGKIQRQKYKNVKFKKQKPLKTEKSNLYTNDKKIGNYYKKGNSFEESVAYLRRNHNCRKIALPSGEEIIRIKKSNTMNQTEDVDVESYINCDGTQRFTDLLTNVASETEESEDVDIV